MQHTTHVYMVVLEYIGCFLGFWAAFSRILFPFKCTLIELNLCFTYDELESIIVFIFFIFKYLFSNFPKWSRKTVHAGSVVSSAWKNVEILFLYLDCFHKMGQQEIFVKVSLEALGILPQSSIGFECTESSSYYHQNHYFVWTYQLLKLSW
jgi:hypothetical protein